jgi:nucleotide-binding universal stress UspA family protein
MGRTPQINVFERRCSLPLSGALMNDRPKMLLAIQSVPSSTDLVDQAAAWAEQLGHTLHLMTIVYRRAGVDRFGGMQMGGERSSIPRETKYWLNEMADRIPVSVRGGVEIVLGEPAPCLIEASKSAELLVMGTHHRANASPLFLGSVTEAVVRGAQCPVMVLSPGARRIPVDGAVNVRLPVDPRHLNSGGIEWLAQHLPNADATAVFAVPWLRIFGQNPEAGTRIHDAAKDQLGKALTEAGHGTVTQKVVVREEANSGDAIAGEAAQAQADLIVLPRRASSGLVHAIVGSVADRTVRAATMTVVVV